MTSKDLDYYIDALPNNLKNKRTAFLLGEKEYEQLCIELKRTVKRYKGYKIVREKNKHEN